MRGVFAGLTYWGFCIAVTVGHGTAIAESCKLLEPLTCIAVTMGHGTAIAESCKLLVGADCLLAAPIVSLWF